MEKLFAVCAPGLEAYTLEELTQVGLLASAQAEAGRTLRLSEEARDEEGGGVEFNGELEAIYRANLHLRTPSRVLVRLGEFYATAFSELRKKASRLSWERYILPGQPVALRVTCRKSRLYHSDAVAERVAGAIGDRLGQPTPMKKDSHTVIIVRLVHDQCTISVDSSGELLHRRGYRLATAKAPLRETLAAGMLLASGWDKTSALIDPFCGSGTIPIEAASLALGIAPGRGRRFAFMDWPGFKPELWEALLDENQQQAHIQTEKLAGRLFIQASDRDAGAIQMAQANAERAGVASWIGFSCQAVSAIEPGDAERGWIVTNPPYGLRISSSKDLRNLYAQLGKVLRAKCPAWQVAILCNDLQLLGQTGLRLDTSLSLVNGGVAVKLARGSVDEGKN